MFAPSLLISILGLIGNGIVLWFLCIRIKRNTYTVYILNLAVADFCLLLYLVVALLYVCGISVEEEKEDEPPEGTKTLEDQNCHSEKEGHKHKEEVDENNHKDDEMDKKREEKEEQEDQGCREHLEQD
ncbi:hypothetical protein NDU88_000707 [Pleurodeles waltl]|uniref:G-protein coupled receptors family 1 profile domain-containing protein n=1 Tax=Pleurodeles waltl TaxID=8319 RepID=A0AAV7KU57_PLEWA|nr:hypothetical protein NDU88_000707 [Pleurodeles waltl]